MLHFSINFLGNISSLTFSNLKYFYRKPICLRICCHFLFVYIFELLSRSENWNISKKKKKCKLNFEVNFDYSCDWNKCQNSKSKKWHKIVNWFRWVNFTFTVAIFFSKGVNCQIKIQMSYKASYQFKTLKTLKTFVLLFTTMPLSQCQQANNVRQRTR